MDTLIILAGSGGFIYNILQLMELIKVPKENRPDFKDWIYWIPYLVWPLLGGLLAYAYLESGLTFSPLIALNVGLSAPLIFRQMINSNPLSPDNINPGEGA